MARKVGRLVAGFGWVLLALPSSWPTLACACRSAGRKPSLHWAYRPQTPVGRCSISTWTVLFGGRVPTDFSRYSFLPQTSSSWWNCDKSGVFPILFRKPVILCQSLSPSPPREDQIQQQKYSTAPDVVKCSIHVGCCHYFYFQHCVSNYQSAS